MVLPLLTKKRTFCGLICPFGAWQAFFGKINPYRVTIIKDKCTRCFRCVAVCPTFAIDKEGVHNFQVSPYCNRCGECMDVCSSGAIDYSNRTLFLLSVWLVGGSVSLLFVPEVLLKLWRQVVGWFS